MKIFWVLLFIPMGIMAQQKPYYLAGSDGFLTNQKIGGNDPATIVYLTVVDKDSIVLSTKDQNYIYSFSYKRKMNEVFLRNNHLPQNYLPNFVFYNAKALAISEEGEGGFLFYLSDKNRAEVWMNSRDKNYFQHYKDSLKNIIKLVNAQRSADQGKITEQLYRKIATGYIKGLQSKRSDPILVRDIKKWSKNESTIVYFPEADYKISKNYKGEVLNKNIHALIKYRMNNKCYIQWADFGYESLGGGIYSTDLTVYSVTSNLKISYEKENMELYEGVAYEIDCF